MCGRFTLTVDAHQIREAFPWITVPEQVQPRYNIAPSQPVAVIPNDSKNQLDFFVWGLVPFWAKDPSIGSRMINARAETVDQKPSFKSAFKYRRCLILADGFYEWMKEPGKRTKTPMYIRMKNDEPFAFAGLWDTWHAADGSDLYTCNIITTQPNELLKDIHNRMPVILPEESYPLWLEPDQVDTNELKPLLVPFRASGMEAHAVSTYVNMPANDSPTCIQPLM
ncbi:MAG: SOS response-associated peptidase [Chloroflexota bacterium]|nr:SOS response-associated peptidase [Chloroflexota bacterium]